MHLILVTYHLAILIVAIDAAVEVVGTRLGDGVDGTTGEARLTNVERSDAHLQLFDGLHREGLSACLSAVSTVRGQTEYIVGHGTVNLDGVIAVVRTGNAHSATLAHSDERVDTSHVSHTVSQRRQLCNTATVNGLGSTVARSSQTSLTRNRNLT